MNLDEFLQAYMVCALWSSCGPDSDPYKCENLDDIFDETDIADSTRKEMEEDCRSFIDSNEDDLRLYAEKMWTPQYTAAERAGHDFWLTRNGHGAGFWDRGLGLLGERLTKACKPYGEVCLYPGDDGKVYS